MELSYVNNPKSLFRKYSKLVTWFANTPMGREYLKLDSEIALLLPNGYHRKVGKNKYEATFYTRAEYAPKLLPALVVLDRARSLIKGFEEAKKLLTWNLGYSHKFQMATATFNPNANPETTSVDGYAARVATEIWATIRAGAGTTADDLGTSLFCQYSTGTAPNWSAFYRTFTLFDTSSLGASAVISSAVQSFYTVTDGNFAVSLRLVTTTPASNTAIVAADFSQQGTVAQATDRTTASMTLNAYNDWTLNATGLGNISKTGITKFGLRVVGDADNVEPTPGDGLTSNMREHQSTDAANKPKLVVTYTVPATPSGSFNFI